MKPTLIFKLLALALGLQLQAGCIQEKTTMVNADGSMTEIQSWRPTERAGALLDAGIRNRLRLPQEDPKRIEPSK